MPATAAQIQLMQDEQPSVLELKILTLAFLA